MINSAVIFYVVVVVVIDGVVASERGLFPAALANVRREHVRDVLSRSQLAEQAHLMRSHARRPSSDSACVTVHNNTNEQPNIGRHGCHHNHRGPHRTNRKCANSCWLCSFASLRRNSLERMGECRRTSAAYERQSALLLSGYYFHACLKTSHRNRATHH